MKRTIENNGNVGATELCVGESGRTPLTIGLSISM